MAGKLGKVNIISEAQFKVCFRKRQLPDEVRGYPVATKTMFAGAHERDLTPAERWDWCRRRLGLPVEEDSTGEHIHGVFGGDQQAFANT